MTQTEKPTTIAEKKKNIVKTLKKQEIIKIPVEKPKEEKVEVKKDEARVKDEKAEKKASAKKQETAKPKVKKHEAIVNGFSVAVSTKKSMAICKFIKRKKIEKAISDLEEVLQKKKVVPMKGEISHQKGKGIMSGGYPKKTSEHFITLLKSLQANANVNDLEEPIIVEAVANFAPRPFGRFGKWKRKRTHIKIVAREKKMIKQKEKGK